MAKAEIRHRGALVQQIGGSGQAGANHQRGSTLTHFRQIHYRQTAGGQRIELRVIEMTVQRTGQIRNQHRAQTETFNTFADKFDITRRQVGTAQHVHLKRTQADSFLIGGDQRVDDPFHRQCETAFKTAGEIRRIHCHNGGVGEFGVLGAEITDSAANIAALGFCQSGGHQADNRRILLFANHPQCFDDIAVCAHHRTDLIHGGGLQWHRFAKMAHEKHLGECRAALRAVHQWHRLADAEKRQRCASGLTGFERADRQRLFPVDQLSHGCSPQPLAAATCGDSIGFSARVAAAAATGSICSFSYPAGS